jgi:ABC-2 type transport system permease protein
MIFAILRAQLLSLRGMGMTRGAARWFGVIPSLLYYGFWTLGAVLIFVFCRYDTDAKGLETALSGGLLGVALYWQIAPVITASMGASLNLQKLIVYPISLDQLFAVEVILRFFTVGEMLLVVAGASFGMLFNPVHGGWKTSLWILGSTLLFIFLNLILAAGVRSLVERGFQRKGMREVGMLIFVLICVAPGIIVGLKLPVQQLLVYLPLRGLFPWAITAQIWVGHPTLEGGVALAVWLAAVYRFARRQFYSSLREDPYGGRAVSRAVSKTGKARAISLEPVFNLPNRLLTDPLAAMVEKELRSLSRCAAFRLAFFMGFSFGILVFLPQAVGHSTKVSFMSEHFLAIVSIYSLMLIGYYTFWNAFGYDRAAAQFYFATPVPFRRVLYAKNIVAIFVQFLEVSIISVVYLFVPLAFHPFAVLEAFLVTAVSCLYVFAIGNITSVRFPVPMDPDRMARGASARSKSALLMMLFPVAFLPIGLAYWGRYVFKSDVVFTGMLLLAGVIGGVIYWVGTDSAVAFSVSRREEMITALSCSDGPLSNAG